MSAPSLSTYQNGSGQVSSDNLNTFCQTCDTIAQLRAFTGIVGIQVYVRGFSAVNDGGQGNFYWNIAGSQVDNGTTVIVPSSAATGAWNRLNFDSIPQIVYTESAPTAGFSITIPNSIGAYIIKPAGTLATGTFIMPSTPYDGQILRVSSSQIVTTLTVNANAGQTIFGAPTTISSTVPFGYIYRLADTSWYRV